MALDARRLIIFHNHPSAGSSEFSREDRRLTKRLVDAGDMIGIPVVDHILIYDGNRHKSLRSIDERLLCKNQQWDGEVI